MQTFDVDGLIFSFPDDWQVGQYDAWVFYRNQFSRMREGIKALDLLAVAPDKTAWLIEVKDYRLHPRTKPSELGEEVACKVFDTLAAILPAKIHASDETEKQVARAVSVARSLRVVLHLEQPLVTSSVLFKKSIGVANLTQKLRQLLKPIYAHPKVLSSDAMGSYGWTVS